MRWEFPDNYRVERLLGVGGFGEVYLATDMRLRRQVALKVIATSGLDEAARSALEVEAQTIAGLNHPGIVTLYELEDIPDAKMMAMEYISGQTLSDRLDEGPSLTLASAVEVVEKVARALAYAHRQGVVHLDLKPGNVIFNEEDEPKLLDFGLSRLAGALPSDAEKIYGTPYFMSPEQIRNERTQAASDIYSLGVMLFLLATGKLPFSGETRIEVFRSHLEHRLPDPRALNADIRPPLAEVIRKALQKDPYDRHATADEMADELAQAGGARMSLVKRGDKHAEELQPTEEDLVRRTIVAGVLEPGLALPREVITEFMLCGAICKGSPLVRMNDYSRNRIRQAFEGRLVRDARSGATLEDVEKKDGQTGREVMVGRDARCVIGDSAKRTLGSSNPRPGQCIVSQLGHDVVETRMLNACAALRVVQMDNALIAGTIFDEPPAGVTLSARQLLKGGETREHARLEHDYTRAPKTIIMRDDAPALSQKVAMRFHSLLTGILTTDLSLESTAVRLGTGELVLAGFADYLSEKTDAEIVSDDIALQWLTDEESERWSRFVTVVKSTIAAGKSAKQAKLMGPTVSQARPKLDDLRTTEPIDDANAGKFSRFMTGMKAGKNHLLYPFNTQFSRDELDGVRYPASDGFPAAYQKRWLEHVMERGDFFSNKRPWLEQWRRLTLAAHLVGLTARGLTLQLQSRDMDRLHVIEATRLIEYFYFFNDALGIILDRDAASHQLWRGLESARPLAPSLKLFL